MHHGASTVRDDKRSNTGSSRLRFARSTSAFRFDLCLVPFAVPHSPSSCPGRQGLSVNKNKDKISPPPRPPRRGPATGELMADLATARSPDTTYGRQVTLTRGSSRPTRLDYILMFHIFNCKVSSHPPPPLSPARARFRPWTSPPLHRHRCGITVSSFFFELAQARYRLAEHVDASLPDF